MRKMYDLLQKIDWVMAPIFLIMVMIMLIMVIAVYNQNQIEQSEMHIPWAD